MASPPDNPNPYQPPQSDAANVPPVRQPGSGKYAACPSCRHNAATRVGWTLWGGALGPWMFTHVKCDSCGTTFNGKTGQSNATAIGIYLGVSLLLGVVGFVVVLCAGAVG